MQRFFSFFKTGHVLFVSVVLIQMLIYNYPYILKIEPRTVHAWRQFDCLSFAQHFYDNSATLAEPRINNLGFKGNGKTASEFPIVPYLVGKTWKLTGISPPIYKLVNTIFLFIGLFFIYKLFLLLLNDKALATLLAAFMFSSPILSYYGVSTISDIQSFSLSMMGFYFFYRWTGNNKGVPFFLFIVCFSLAGLIKASAALIYLVCVSMFFLRRWLGTEPFLYRKQNRLLTPALAIPLLVWMSWYLHVKNYNAENNGGFFLVGLLPAWELSSEQRHEVFHKFIYTVLPQVFSSVILWLLLPVLLAGLFSRTKQFLQSRLLLGICLLLAIGFVVLFFGAMDVHDYYLINVLGLIVAAIFFTVQVRQEWIKANYKRVVIALSLLTGIFSYLSGIKTWKKINCNVNNFENKLVFNADEQKNYFWIYWLDREMYKTLEDKTLNLEKAGVAKKDTIFCLGDNTINRALFILNRQGYSGFNASPEETPAFITSHPNIRFLVLLDPHLKDKPYLGDVLKNRVFEQGTLTVYKLR